MQKNKYTYVWVSLVVLVFGIIFIPRIIDRLQEGTVVQNDRMNLKGDNERLAFVEMNGKKRKVPSFAFVNQDSLMITNRDFDGKVYIVEFFFTSCPTICPIMNRNLVELQDEFKEFDDFGVASFTIDPENDTPSVLKAYAEDYGVTNMDWHFLTGDMKDIYELANTGFSIFAAQMPEAAGGFEHAGLFALIDKNGFIRSRTDKFGNPIIYYRGAITESEKVNDHGEEEQISILKRDIRKLLEE
ncbi:SCO family protein [Arenibacter certesii]|uniref:Photosynthetic protein synthase II n=1 Tax=Arenibacter certesii TaxID=228955 RepID=A0A918IT62_9FLAO|nr:SCO family protein [Arenibacter certesii]GGW29629.1 photosynthetic protein synthase II [Arenibacter certesii]